MLALGLLAGCTAGSGPGATPTSPSKAPADPGRAATPSPAAVGLPADPLRAFVPSPAEVPTGMLPVVSGSGSRDLLAVAAFSGEPTAAAAALRAHGFRRAYVAQYAEQQAAGRVLSVVVVEFDDPEGAADDLAADVAAAGPASPASVGTGGSLGCRPLPGGRGQVCVLRFRVGSRTFLLGFGAPAAESETVLRLGRVLAGRAGAA